MEATRGEMGSEKEREGEGREARIEFLREGGKAPRSSSREALRRCHMYSTCWSSLRSTRRALVPESIGHRAAVCEASHGLRNSAGSLTCALFRRFGKRFAYLCLSSARED
jgi:hypothetical protein